MNVKKWTALCVTILLMLSFVCAMPAWAEDESEGASSSPARRSARRLLRNRRPPRLLRLPAVQKRLRRLLRCSSPPNSRQILRRNRPPQARNQPRSHPPASLCIMRNRPPSLVKRPPRGLPPRLGRLHPESRFPALSACRRWAQRFIPFPTCSAPA